MRQRHSDRPRRKNDNRRRNRRIGRAPRRKPRAKHVCPILLVGFPPEPVGRFFSILPGMAILPNARKTPIQPPRGKL
jgi:hypothetical protein